MKFKIINEKTGTVQAVCETREAALRRMHELQSEDIYYYNNIQEYKIVDVEKGEISKKELEEAEARAASREVLALAQAQAEAAAAQAEAAAAHAEAAAAQAAARAAAMKEMQDELMGLFLKWEGKQ